jgi:hypothetical protein
MPRQLTKLIAVGLEKFPNRRLFREAVELRPPDPRTGLWMHG